MTGGIGNRTRDSQVSTTRQFQKNYVQTKISKDARSTTREGGNHLVLAHRSAELIGKRGEYSLTAGARASE